MKITKGKSYTMYVCVWGGVAGWMDGCGREAGRHAYMHVRMYVNILEK